MKTILAALVLAFSSVQAQQKNAGIIEYEVTSRMDLANARIVMMGPGGQVTQGSPADMGMAVDAPDLITTKQILTFSSTKGKLEVEGGGAPQMLSFQRTMPAGGATAGRAQTIDVAGNAGGNATFSSAPGGPGMSLRPPLSNSTYIDLANKKYLTVTTEKKDSVTSNSWYAEEDYKKPADIKTSNKTKTIAGFKCQRGTVKLGEENFVFWYTTEIPLLFSPVNGVLPAEGVVLSIESSKRSYVAKKVEFKPIEETEVSLPANAQKITDEELKAKRRQIMEKFHNDRLEKLQLNNN